MALGASQRRHDGPVRGGDRPRALAGSGASEPAASPESFFTQITEIENGLDLLLGKIDECYAAHDRIAATRTSVPPGARLFVETALAFDLAGLRRAVGAAQAIALCGPEDAARAASIAPLLEAERAR